MSESSAATKGSNAGQGKVALVTGASSGIGEATAACLARAGFRVVLAARRQAELERLADEIAASGGEALAVATDLADELATRALAERALEAFGRVDVLVNNAGYSPAAAIEQLSRDELRNVFDVNVLAGLQLVGEFTPGWRDQGGGRVINISSLASHVPAPLAVPYAATKGAIDVAPDGLRLELAPWNISVSLVVPGFVDTPVFDKAREWGTRLREDETNPYRQLMFDMDDFAKAQLKRAVAPSEVGDLVVAVATATRPRARYFVPFSARLAEGLFRNLPTRLSDKALIRMYKLPVA